MMILSRVLKATSYLKSKMFKSTFVMLILAVKAIEKPEIINQEESRHHHHHD